MPDIAELPPPSATPMGRAMAVAREQAGVLSRVQLYGLGVTRSQVRAHLAARRWRRCLSQSVAVATGPLTEEARRWVAVFEAGPRAFLDGSAALVAAGLDGFTPETIRVSVPRGARVRRAPGLNIRQTRRWQADDVVTTAGPPRSRPEVAAVRAAIWAVSDKQAGLLLTMPVQQGIVNVERLVVELVRIRRDKRRQLLADLLLDLAGGVRSIGELEFAEECRGRGLPEPSRQALRRGRDGRHYLDALWEAYGVAVEVDGLHHVAAPSVVADALRQNDLSLQGMTVLRLPLLGLRVAPDDFFAQIERALVAGGWSPLGASA